MENNNIKQTKKKDTNKIKESHITQEVDSKELIPNILVMKTHEIYNQFIIEGTPFKLYFRENIIYDTKNKQKFPIFNEDYFIIANNKYIYKGTRIEIY